MKQRLDAFKAQASEEVKAAVLAESRKPPTGPADRSRYDRILLEEGKAAAEEDAARRTWVGLLRRARMGGEVGGKVPYRRLSPR